MNGLCSTQWKQILINFNLLSQKTDSHTLQIGDLIAKSVSSVTLLGITIDSKLNFKDHINNIMKKHIINYMP